MLDTIVIGGGVAGLQAALTLGRMHRRTVLLDSGEYRNATVEHAHNFITLDGQSPEKIRDAALREIAAYDSVEVRHVRADRVERTLDGFAVTVGSEVIEARAVILATGLRDVLPEVPGLAEVWGAEAASCPFCHGHEAAGRRVALLGMGEHAAMMAAMLEPVVSESLALDEITAVERIVDGLRLQLPGGDHVDVAALFLKPAMVQAAPFAQQLGLSLLPSGCVEVDLFGMTSIPGVFAAGDLAHHRDLPGPMASLVVAAAAGQMAAATSVRVAASAEPARAS